jgi:hypothetical protein
MATAPANAFSVASQVQQPILFRGAVFVDETGVGRMDAPEGQMALEQSLTADNKVSRTDEGRRELAEDIEVSRRELDQAERLSRLQEAAEGLELVFLGDHHHLFANQ